MPINTFAIRNAQHLALASLVVAAGCSVIDDGLLAGDRDAATDRPDGADDDGAVGIDGAPVPNLRLHYTFEGDGTMVADVSGHGFAGMLSDAAARSDTGRTGRGLTLGGGAPATQYVTLPSGVLDDVGDFTIATWIKVAVNTPWARIYDLGNGAPDPQNRFMFMTVAGFDADQSVGLHTTSYGGSTANEALLSARAFLPTGVWKHVAITGTAGARRLFVDGFPVAELTGAPDVPPREMEPLSPNSWIGRSRFASDPGLSGSLDDFRIYDRILTAAELAELAWPGTDYSYWRFDDGEGTIARDSSDRANGATASGGAGWTAGRLGMALDLPGGAAGSSGPHVALASSPLAGCTNRLSIALWVKVGTLTANSRLFDFGTGTALYLYLAPTDGTGTHVGMQSPAGTFDLVTTAPAIADDGEWHHVALVVDASTVLLYVDGAVAKQQTSPTVRPSDFAATTDNWLGRSRVAHPAFDGAIDELRISCRAFTPDEIKMLSAR
ncbi:MAG TPA: LamG domain-containing protein [Kofleriaceae bacterium]|jgi:hypothetical protein|nr:LamG domain-containing protein [Kofleriaceae bacterium]